MGIPNKLQINSEHCRAICDEIGERLRVILSRDPPDLPVQLRMLLSRLAEQDAMILAPSIVPSIGEMVRPLRVSDEWTELARVA